MLLSHLQFFGGAKKKDVLVKKGDYVMCYFNKVLNNGDIHITVQLLCLCTSCFVADAHFILSLMWRAVGGT